MKSLINNSFDIIFIDWHGVLGLRGFWCEQGKKDEKLRSWLNKVFSDKNLLERWMRGEVTIDQLPCIDGMTAQRSKEYLIESYKSDAKYYGPSFEFLDFIKASWVSSRRILLLDNMDIFKDHFLTDNANVLSYFDDIILSCDYGCLKIDSNKNLFDVALKNTGKENFENCLLIDDDIRNINFFKENKGNCIFFN